MMGTFERDGYSVDSFDRVFPSLNRSPVSLTQYIDPEARDRKKKINISAGNYLRWKTCENSETLEVYNYVIIYIRC